jgi:hypothetical protein
MSDVLKENMEARSSIRGHTDAGAGDRVVAWHRPSAGFGFQPHMTHTLEISLRIPSLRVHREGKESPETIANGEVRFIKQVDLEAVPKPGEVLTMTVGPSGTFQCEVVRCDWHHSKNMFVSACRYSKRSISEAEYQALMDASDWTVRALL